MPADIVTSDVRSRMMSGIRSTHTKPELVIRSALHSRGYRFRLHRRDLPGKPDLVFPKYKAVILVHGCFWHGHDCYLFKWPKTREEFWRDKIESNIARDYQQLSALCTSGWRVAIIWECALKGRKRLSIEIITEHCMTWLDSNVQKMELSGNETRAATRLF